MLKKEITYLNFDEEKVTETFYFDLNKAEAIELNLVGTTGGKETLEQVAKSKDPEKLCKTIREIISRSVCVRSTDGKRLKSNEISAEFMSSDAYSELFMELISAPGAGEAFMRAILPK